MRVDNSERIAALSSADDLEIQRKKAAEETGKMR